MIIQVQSTIKIRKALNIFCTFNIFYIKIQIFLFYEKALLSGLTIHSIFLINYTPLASIEVPAVKEIKASDHQISLLISNVKMANRKSQSLIKLIQAKNPDLILAMEANEWWSKQLEVLKNDYPYSQHTINDVAYGMVLLSKFPLEKVEVE